MLKFFWLPREYEGAITDIKEKLWKACVILTTLHIVINFICYHLLVPPIFAGKLVVYKVGKKATTVLQKGLVVKNYMLTIIKYQCT